MGQPRYSSLELSSGAELADERPPSRFTDNFVRLLGLHGLSQNFTAQLLGVSEASMSAWMNGRSTPSLAKAIDIAELFGISTDQLMGAEFVDLLQTDLADPERFKKVEDRIRRARTPLKAV
jgi:transcriptional regulator with XRE-family HTH domain